ncbi:protein bric-a-brac 1-like [Euwallacea fornicatus]|uniref:protein bric-a-brac 1-like n=1 Tax=Euwallacea fornicatus TaxID=995702 RepID=UPI00338F0A71
MDALSADSGAGDQYNLKWNNHLTNFVQTFIQHQLGETLVDVTLSCEGQYIKTHKLILSACSDYFHSIFQVHSTLQHPIIFLNHVRFTDLKSILHFMYHGEVKVLDKDLPQVLQLGETLQIKGLSSVKLRDVPPETLAPVQTVAKKNNKVMKNSHFGSQRKNDSRTKCGVKIVTPNQLNAASSINAQTAPVSSAIILPAEPLSPRTSKVLVETPSKSSTSHTAVSPNINNTEVRNVIPKTPHAFMIFASEWRKKLTIEHPEENNKEISVRLANMWKNLLPEDKNRYYTEAKKREEEAKLKYPNHIDSNDSLKRKSEVLQDTTNSTSPRVQIDPMEVVEIQEQVEITDSD